MKNIYLYILGIIILTFGNLSYANSPEPIEGSGLNKPDGQYEIRSSDNIEIEVENLEKVIIDNADLSQLTPVNVPIISGINDFESEIQNNRTCIYCWIFLIMFAIWLFGYGMILKNDKAKNQLLKHWFILPVIVGILVYFVHGQIHQYFASTIFLEYYGLLIFDELAVGYVAFSIMLSKNSKIENKKIKKAYS